MLQLVEIRRALDNEHKKKEVKDQDGRSSISQLSCWDKRVKGWIVEKPEEFRELALTRIQPGQG